MAAATGARPTPTAARSTAWVRSSTRGGLRNLEYRGYDSAGVALVGESSGLTVAKRSGEVDGLTVPDVPDATHGVGHTRWSTHGPPTDANAHPHTDCASDVAVVHNGIVENYEALKAELSDHKFTSDTDTEVIPHLIDRRRARSRSRRRSAGRSPTRRGSTGKGATRSVQSARATTGSLSHAAEARWCWAAARTRRSSPAT